MRDVAIVGIGMSRFGKYPEKGLKDLVREAVEPALKDAKLNSKDIDALLIRAGISLATNDVARGIADLRTLLKERPGHVRALRLKARSHLTKQDIELAKKFLNGLSRRSRRSLKPTLNWYNY